METFEKAYTTKEIAENLDIGQSTLRKWAMSLEANGYSFAKNDQGYRLFVERDIEMLTQFKKLVKEQNMPLENASNLIIEHLGQQSFSTRTEVALSQETTVVPTPRSAEVDEKLLAFMEEQEAFNQKLLAVIEQQQKTIQSLESYIDEKLEKRDSQMMSVIRESQETKKLLLEQKAQKEAQKNQKVGFFKRLFQ
ncbi:DUF3967 domain-containing protein [Priestia koreensis]|uniref:DUF3967 domain-containing protein n=1 Tax=Priestia koreensis TaxID=284581 RepID=UPI00204206A9|nr:DUF3967 domain-containing protein [Priestia koreensis]MCM3006844.1 DUF3967 domain-containing protein [Priestia koreensis]